MDGEEMNCEIRSYFILQLLYFCPVGVARWLNTRGWSLEFEDLVSDLAFTMWLVQIS